MTANDPIADTLTITHKDAMEAVYILHHVRSNDEYGDDAKLIGVYRTEASAMEATRRLSCQPGFADNLEGWQISRYTLDRDHWEEGFGVS